MTKDHNRKMLVKKPVASSMGPATEFCNEISGEFESIINQITVV
jgi:hypothetical protein